MQSLPLDYDPDLLDVERMAVTEKRVHSIESDLGQIAQRLAKLEGHKDESAAPHKSPNAALIAVLSVLGMAVIWYWSWVGTQVVAQGKQISQILTILSPEIVKKASSQPENPQSAKQVEQIVKKAMKQGERLDPALVSEAGAKFTDAVDRTPDAWRAATALLDYASFLNVNAPNPQPIMQLNETPTKYLPQQLEGRVAIGRVLGTAQFPNLPEAHPLNQPDQNANLASGPAFFLIRNGDFVLDGMLLKNVIIQDSQVIYDGGPLVLQNVYFVNCTFKIKRQPKSLEFARAIFGAHPSVNLKQG